MKQKIHESAAAIRPLLSETPRAGVILGSGLGDLAQRLEQPSFLDYEQIPHFARSTAPTHKGRLVAGYLGGTYILCMQGRFHGYEGYTPQQTAYPIWVMKELGIKTLLVTCACGGINTDFSVGDLMLITDHINFTGRNPLVGPNDEAIGPRFPDMSYAYAPHLRQLALDTAKEMGLSLQQGVYISCLGPSYETPAEIRAFRILGADAVGMSTVPEVIAANHCGLQVLAFGLITNMAAGVLEQRQSLEEVIQTGKEKSRVLQELVTRIAARL